MNDQDFMNRLGEAARAERKFTAQLEELAAGQLPAEDRQHLEQEARTNPELRAALDLCQPLGSSFEQRLLARAKEQVKRAPEPEVKSQRVPVPDKKPWWAGWQWLFLAPAAAGAVAAVLMVMPGQQELPGYQLEVSHGAREFRGDAAPAVDAPRLVPGSRLRLDVRPQQLVEGDVDVRVFLAGASGLQRVNMQVQKAQGGALRLEGVVGTDLQLPNGESLLHILVSRAGDITNDEQARSAILQPTGSPKVALMQTRVMVVPTPQ